MALNVVVAVPQNGPAGLAIAVPPTAPVHPGAAEENSSAPISGVVALRGWRSISVVTKAIGVPRLSSPALPGVTKCSGSANITIQV